ncbi:MAG: gliding motility-associated C-terminal domain-containing protein [Chitinophagales bacterium]|nr:gliding motility-associated C-terminal domain-containing protein [Chitinophagaceae bacterium]MCB9064064.1 gliding motility-associated C-terminal domain-containing protein [Chitinophagales bacterium]
MRSSRAAFVLLLSLFISTEADATHIYGAELFYTHITGNTYRVEMNVYGDCSGSSFPQLPGTAKVQVYNNTTFITTLSLPVQAPTNGVEVTPVCPSQKNNTKCTNTSNPIPGVKKYHYAQTITLTGTSSNWRFRFTGDLTTSTAGRSNSLTNIINPSSSTMNLEATLNNTSGPNSSPTYTTIPTPFFCINKAANYNPGSVDPNNDSLVYSLVAGLTATSVVVYQSGYSATAPLAVVTSSLNFSTTTGQLSFTPNLVQQSSVTNKVEEYKNGVLVGTSMREMTFVVLNNCNNNPPGGLISNNNAGTLDTSQKVLNVCKSAGNLTFNINPTDPDTDKINVTANGLPAGATFVVTNNNTTAPTGSFSWNLSSVTPGTYNFFITYVDEGCPLSSKQTLAYTIVVLPDPKVTLSIDTPATCSKKAIISMTPSVSPSPWRLQIFQGATQIHNFTGVTGVQTDSLSPGTYTIRVTNSDTCFKDTVVVIPAPPEVILNLNVTHPTCHGDTNGKVIVTGSGGLSPFTYALNGGAFSSTNTFSNLGAGFYTFYVKDSNDCVADSLLQIIDPPSVGAIVDFTQPPCNYYNSGVIKLTGTNGTAPYLYALDASPYSSTNVYSGLFSGNYTIHVKDSNDCRLDSVVTLPDSVRVHANAVLTHILCNSDSTGSIVLTAFGAMPPYKYQITGGPLTSSGTFNNLPAATHTFHIEDTNKCYLDTNITLNEPTEIFGVSNVTNVLCNGDTSGAITITGTGGVNPYTYTMGTGAYSSANNYSPLSAGTYTIHIKDANNCIKDTNITITEPTELYFNNIVVSDAICYNSATGQVVLDGTGGVSPYTYAIGAGAYGSNSTFSNISAGTYTFHLQDDNGCIRDTSLTIDQPTRIVPSANLKKATCNDVDDGAATLSATGGTPGYTYAINTNPFSSSTTFSPLGAGTYTLKVKDANNCIQDTIVNIVDSLVVTANITPVNAKCFDSSSGTITVVAGGGVNPYTFALNTGAFGTSNIFNSLPAGSYDVHIKDDLGCSKDTTLALTEPTRLVPRLNITEITCHGYRDGFIVMNASGGTFPYNYRIDTSFYSTINIFNSLNSRTYTFFVRDANNCIMDTTIFLNQPAELRYTLDIYDVLCKGEFNGIVNVNNSSGGVSPYTYAYDLGLYTSNPQLTGLDSGEHVIHMKDSTGCIKDSTILINEPDLLLLENTNIITPTCEEYTDGAIQSSGKGGITPYQYALNGGTFSSSGSFDNLLAGTYTLTLKDANNCTYDTTIDLNGFPPILLNDVQPMNVSCKGFSDGSVEVNATGGIQPFTYRIGDGPFGVNNLFKDLIAGKYSFTVLDDSGCTKTINVDITEPEALFTKTTATPNDCEGYDDGGHIAAEVSGGTTPYKYEWSTQPVQYGQEAGGLKNGQYAVFVTDANDCLDTALATVEYNNCCKLFIPNAFTPNGDGLNDILRILLKGDFELEVFSIYNRYGEQVFTTTNMEEGWNGVYKGVQQKMDTYNYFVKGLCGKDAKEEVMYKGNITLVR